MKITDALLELTGPFATEDNSLKTIFNRVSIKYKVIYHNLIKLT